MKNEAKEAAVSVPKNEKPWAKEVREITFHRDDRSESPFLNGKLGIS